MGCLCETRDGGGCLVCLVCFWLGGGACGPFCRVVGSGGGGQCCAREVGRGVTGPSRVTWGDAASVAREAGLPALENPREGDRMVEGLDDVKKYNNNNKII